MNRKIILPVVLLTGALTVGTLGFSTIAAQEGTSYPSIVEKLAEKFGLNKDEVMSVFDEVHADHHAQMLANFEDRLNKAVEEGKITLEQKQKILDKQEEVRAKMDEWKDLTPEERREKMKAFHQETKSWAEENGIEFPFMVFKALRPDFGHRFKAGMMFEHKLD